MELRVHLEDHSYPITIERHALEHISDYFNTNRKIALITDSGVPQKWVDLVKSQIKDCVVLCVKQGEASKSIEVWKELLEALCEHHFTRKDAVLALGGGVVGDLAGFTAACYMRGIDFYNCPTTLLSQVDSSVGGKTAVDLGSYKNIVGAFYQPKAVVIDPEVLSTLDTRQTNAGLVEALKMGCILDEDLIEAFEKEELDIDAIIARSIDLKRIIVEQDEKEGGLRAILNFGHTIGHAIESHTHLQAYLHGECVGFGMPYFIEDADLKKRIQYILKEKLHQPSLPECNPDDILELIKHDKKGGSDFVTVVKVDKAGTYRLEKMCYDDIYTLLKETA
jgi:3-dehydroquinate synthase